MLLQPQVFEQSLFLFFFFLLRLSPAERKERVHRSLTFLSEKEKESPGDFRRKKKKGERKMWRRYFFCVGGTDGGKMTEVRKIEKGARGPSPTFVLFLPETEKGGKREETAYVICQRFGPLPPFLPKCRREEEKEKEDHLFRSIPLLFSRDHSSLLPVASGRPLGADFAKQPWKGPDSAPLLC